HPAEEHGKQRGEQREVRHEQPRDDHGDGPAEAAELPHRRARPVDRPAKINGACEKSDQERASAIEWQSRPRRIEQRDDERSQRDPRKRWMAVTRETEGEKRAGDEREDQGRVTCWPRCRSHSTTPGPSSGAEMNDPWALSHPSSASRSSVASSFTPSATHVRPRLCASSMVDCTITSS